MPESNIIIPEKKGENHTRERLKRSYIASRKVIDITETELHRSSVVVMDENGEVMKFNLLREH